MKNSHAEARKVEAMEEQSNQLAQINRRLSRIEATLGIGDKPDKKKAIDVQPDESVVDVQPEQVAA